MKSIMIFFVLLFTGFLSSGFEKPPVCEESPKPDCYCILIYDPVCGCNNKTYGNACEAGCAGITEYKKGECKVKKPKKDQ